MAASAQPTDYSIINSISARPLSRLAVNFMAGLAFSQLISRLSRDFCGGSGLAFSWLISRLKRDFCSGSGLAFSWLIFRLIRGLRSSSIGAPSLPLSLHIRSDSFTAWRRASSLQTFFCRSHAMHNRPIFNAVCIILCDLL